MKRFIITGLFSLITVSLMVNSCSKEDMKNNSFEVEYRIDPLSNLFTKIIYNDQTETAVVLNDPSLFENGIKKINVSKKPFTAKISTEVNNQTNTPFNYDLYILVDGQLKKFVHGSAPPLAVFSRDAEFIVE